MNVLCQMTMTIYATAKRHYQQNSIILLQIRFRTKRLFAHRARWQFHVLLSSSEKCGNSRCRHPEEDNHFKFAGKYPSNDNQEESRFLKTPTTLPKVFAKFNRYVFLIYYFWIDLILDLGNRKLIIQWKHCSFHACNSWSWANLLIGCGSCARSITRTTKVKNLTDKCVQL